MGFFVFPQEKFPMLTDKLSVIDLKFKAMLTKSEFLDY